MAQLEQTPRLDELDLSDGSFLVAGKTVTGFANVEEEFGDEALGVQIMPWRPEDALRSRGANYVQAGLFKPLAIREYRCSLASSCTRATWSPATS